jgi:hypothetical protein
MGVQAPGSTASAKGIRVNRIIRQRMTARKRRLARRLDKHNYPEDVSRPVLRSTRAQYELAGRGAGTAYGGIGLMQQLVRTLGLALS